MRYSLLAAVAALALAAPAAAQTNPPSLSDQLQMPVAPAGLGERITGGVESTETLVPSGAGALVAPAQLDASQIRQIQQSLRAQGFQVRRVDGVWGPETAAAVQSFQQQQNPTAPPGQLDAQTLNRLGVSTTAALGLQRGPGLLARPGTPGAPVPGSGLPVSAFGGQRGPAAGAGFGSDLGGARGAAFGSGMNPPSTPGLGAPGNNGMNPPASMGIPDATRPAGFRR